MQVTLPSMPVPIRVPGPGSNGEFLGKAFPNYNGYVDNPIENSHTKDAVESASDSTKNPLRKIDLTNIKPDDLGRLGAELFTAGQISSVTAAAMIVQQVDGNEPINFMQVLEGHQAALEQIASNTKASPFNFGIASYHEAQKAAYKLSEFVRAITPNPVVDVMT